MLLRKLFPSKEMRAYRKMHRKHRRELVKLAKETVDWDWIFLHRMVLMQIRHMYEYYVANNNVWQADESRMLIIGQMEYVLDLGKRIEDMEDEDLGAKLVYRDEGSATYEYPDDYANRVKDYMEREQALYESLYSSIGKNLRWWWD